MSWKGTIGNGGVAYNAARTKQTCWNYCVVLKMRRYVKASQKNKTTTNTQCATCVAYLFAGTAPGIIVQCTGKNHGSLGENKKAVQIPMALGSNNFWGYAAKIIADNQALLRSHPSHKKDVPKRKNLKAIGK